MAFSLPSLTFGQNISIDESVDKLVLKVSAGDFSNIREDYEIIMKQKPDFANRKKLALTYLDFFAVMGLGKEHAAYFNKFYIDGLLDDDFIEKNAYAALQRGYAALFAEEYQRARVIFFTIINDKKNEKQIRCRAYSQLMEILQGPTTKSFELGRDILYAYKSSCSLEFLTAAIQFQQTYQKEIFTIDFDDSPQEFLELVFNSDDQTIINKINYGMTLVNYYLTEQQPTVALAYTLKTLTLIRKYGYQDSYHETLGYFYATAALSELNEPDKARIFVEKAFENFEKTDLESYSIDTRLELLGFAAASIKKSSISSIKARQLVEQLLTDLNDVREEDIHLFETRMAGHVIVVTQVDGTIALKNEKAKSIEALKSYIEEIEEPYNDTFRVYLTLSERAETRNEKVKYLKTALEKLNLNSDLRPISKMIWKSVINYQLAVEYYLHGDDDASDLLEAEKYAENSVRTIFKAIELDYEKIILKTLDDGKLPLLSIWYETLSYLAILAPEEAPDTVEADMFEALKYARYNSDRRAFFENTKRISSQDIQKFPSEWLEGLGSLLKTLNKLETAFILERENLISLLSEDWQPGVNTSMAAQNVVKEYLVQTTIANQKFESGKSYTDWIFDVRDIFKNYLRAFSQAKELLPWDTIYLVTHSYNSQYTFTIITSEFIFPMQSVDKKIIDANIDKIWESVTVLNEDPKLSDFNFTASHEIYKEIFEHSLAKAFIGEDLFDRLVFFGDGKLENFPLELLVSKMPTEKDLAANEVAWLDNQLEIFYDFDISEIIRPSNLFSNKNNELTSEPKLFNKSFLGFGAPKLSAMSSDLRAVYFTENKKDSLLLDDFLKKLPSLKNAREELSSIRRKFSGDKSDLAMGENATEKNLRELDLAKYEIMMFSTHTIQKNEHPLVNETSLVLTPDETNSYDNLLSASEIMELNLNAEIVFLNACNTAAVDSFNKSSMSSLATAFTIAGSRSVMLSHWPISDNSTKLIMEELFNTLTKQPNISYSEALSKAKKKIRRNINLAHPFHWGAFKIYEPFVNNALAEFNQ